MKRITSYYLLLLLLALCGCESTENSKTKILLDTVVTLTADCSVETLDGAFLLCEDYEKRLSCHSADSEVYKLNNSNGFFEVSDETLKIIDRALYYSKKTDGKFDITVYPVSILWDFNNQIVPERKEIAEALKNVDYESIEADNNKVNLNGKKIDLGSIAKGYIADRLKEYLINNGTNRAIINLGGNLVVFGKDYNIGIAKPFEDGIIATITLRDKACVTSGIYQRYIKDGDTIYHHILDTNTGYGVENSLAGVTIIGDSAMDCDALSTVCMLLGKDEAVKLIEDTEDTEAVFIERNGDITLTNGLTINNKNEIKFKQR